VLAADPRSATGSPRELIADKVEVNKSPTGSKMSHLAVYWGGGRTPKTPDHGSIVNYNGPVVNSHGAGAQIAFNNRDVSFSGDQAVTPGVEALAKAVAEALELLAAVKPDDDEDRQIAEESGQNVLT
jgi:hypothetical protein